MMLRLMPVLLVVLALLLAPSASAQTGETNAPPGNSAIDEYVETVPGATGSRPPRRPGEAAPAGATLAPAQRQELERQGADGRALAALVEATAPAPSAANTVNRRPPASTPTAEQALAIADAGGESPVRSALAAAVAPNDAGGLGVLFPLFLLGSLAGMVALAVRRHRA